MREGEGENEGLGVKVVRMIVYGGLVFWGVKMGWVFLVGDVEKEGGGRVGGGG